MNDPAYTLAQRAQRIVNRWLDHLGCVSAQEFTTDELAALRRIAAEEIAAVNECAVAAGRLARESERRINELIDTQAADTGAAILEAMADSLAKWKAEHQAHAETKQTLAAMRLRLGWAETHARAFAQVADSEKAGRIEAEARVAELVVWQDAVVAEVLAHPGLPCAPEEVTIEYVPALLATMAGRIEHADDYEGPAKAARAALAKEAASAGAAKEG